MTFIITLIVLTMERFFHWHHFREWLWFLNYERWLSEHSVRLPNIVRLIMSITPPLVIIGVIGYVLSGWFYGIAELIFGVIVLLYCLGPYNLWVQVYRCIDELQKENPEVAIESAKKAFGVSASNNSQVFHKSLVRAIFIAAHERIFSVIFWFVVFGPMGAVLYRLIALFSVREELDLTDIALKIKQAMDWIPVRIFTFIFALGGHFTEVFACWKIGVGKGLDSNENLLADCGVAALDVMEGNNIPEMGAAEKEALELLDRVFAMVLVLLAIIVIVI
jgi:AmpE protein